jgi:hypothetical protein
MPLFVENFLYELRQRFLLRWILANVVGWMIGLYAGVLNPICFAGAGIIAGLVLGAAQWWALRNTSFGIYLAENDENIPNIPTRLSQIARRWIGLTFLGAAVGLFPAAVLGAILFLFTSGLAALLAGAALGLAVGLAQWMLLKGVSQQVALWLLVNTLGGAACGWLTLTPIIRGLPIGMLLGSALFGYLTGRVLERIFTEINP